MSNAVNELCESTRQDLVAALKDDTPFELFTDPPFASHRAMLFVLYCELAYLGLGVVAVITSFFSWVAALVIAAVVVLAWVLKFVVNLVKILPSRRGLRECVVRPAVVVQAYPGGFVPPDEDPDTPRFTGIVVFSYDESVTGEQLLGLAGVCFEAKNGPDDGPLAELKQLLLFGDTEWDHRTFRMPKEALGNDRTYATTILFDRDNDLLEGYLSNTVQLIFAHPDHPEHVAAVPKRFQDEARVNALLNPPRR